ncbi:(E2-independent) E3 ubiquitin-conjugating enzyme FATS [Motacilla alba alba]|uniref:(E2-independent) E3 ubiquitin-conjugating enzyme FATS n=1 Tax=Motacilla alba alba TaxID=1094192 RepID=UPI0018D55AC5|nr:(E2-independent) E3 ubiquitin-conjugating enzyme FATS [Motacilla alba alba]
MPERSRDAQPFGSRMFCTGSCRETRLWGVTQKHWGPDGQRTCTALQQESGVWGKSSPTKESLPSQNTALISPVILAQIDEDKPRGNQPSLPMQALIPQPRACHTEPSLPNQGSAIVSRTFLVLPSRLEIQASLEDTMSPSDSPSPKQCPSQQRGFASITVTARRVPVGSGDLARGPGAGQEPSTVSPTSSKVPALLERWPPPAHANQPPLNASKSCSKLGEEPQKQLFDPGIKEDGVGLQSSDRREKTPPSFISCVQLQVSEPCPNTIYYLDKSLSVCIDQPPVKCQKMYRSTLSLSLKCSLSGLTADGVDGIANGEPMEERAPRKLPGAHRAPLRAHLSTDFTGNKVIKEEKAKEGHLGRKYPLQTVFASGLPAFVDIPRGPHKAAAAKEEDEQPGSHHTVFSLQIPNSSNEAGTLMLLGSRKRSSTTTPGSLPDAASRETIAAAPDGSSNGADPSKDTSKPKEIPAQGVLKPKMSVFNSVCNIKASSRILWEENVHGQKQLLKSNYESPAPRDRTKELEAQDERERARRLTLSRLTLSRVPLSRATLSKVPLPKARSPGVTWEKNLLTWPEPSSQLEKTPAAPWTLREALELHNPQFISRSQQRLKRLELMVQLRRAQHREAPPGTPQALARKLSTSTSSKKRQFTIPDPLSDNLFKPKERVIPEKEMHMRSKRIYDNLPEVKKKQEEKQKRIILQSNRLRVEMFKKQLLDQLLHRNTE